MLKRLVILLSFALPAYSQDRNERFVDAVTVFDSASGSFSIAITNATSQDLICGSVVASFYKMTAGGCVPNGLQKVISNLNLKASSTMLLAEFGLFELKSAKDLCQRISFDFNCAPGVRP